MGMINLRGWSMPRFCGALLIVVLFGCVEDEVETVEVDGDGDGWTVEDGDCDDEDARTYPGADEICDGRDNDCDGFYDAGEVDHDQDDVMVCEGDCDDTDDDLHPGQWEDPLDGIDSDCGGSDATDGDIALSTADTALIGNAEQEQSGWSVAPAGDVDGDGFGDVLVGAYCNQEGGANAGKTYLMFGSTIRSGGVIGLSNADASFTGENNGGRSGYSVASAGDVDGDGLDDVLIGAEDASGDAPEDEAWAGKTYLMFGRSVQAGGAFELGAADASFMGEGLQDRSGISVASAGDVDGDGLDDILIGAYANDEGGLSAGKTYLMFGETIQSGGDFDLSEADAAFIGEEDNHGSGWSVASAGDVDGDGLDDILIGAAAQDIESYYSGTYLMFGRTFQAGGMYYLESADATFEGESDEDWSGWSVAPAGDVDGDGLDDILIGAKHNDEGGEHAGKTYLMFGDTISAGGAFDLVYADAAFVGKQAFDHSGCSVASAGDVDGDGLDDVLIGSDGQGGGLHAAGRTLLMFGATIQQGGSFDLGRADAVFVGEAELDYSGHSVASAGDVDGDGLDDVLIGAYSNSDVAANAGKSYVLLSPY